MSEKNKIFKATLLVFVLSLIAKIIGFIKSIIQASIFGATVYTDAYNVTNGFVSNILYMFTTAIAVAFVPIYIQHKSDKKDEYVFASRVITDLFILSLFVTILLEVIAPYLVYLIAPSFSPELKIIATKYFRVLLLGFAFSLVANLFTNLLNSEKVYGFSSLGSIINSLVLITFILFFSSSIGVWSLVISIPVSFFVQWLILYVKGNKYAKFTFKFGLKDESMVILVLQATPILISQATVEINQVVDRALLSSVGTGVLTSVSYAAVLYQFVTTIVSTPLSTVIFTELSEAGFHNDTIRIKNLLNKCYKILIVFCVPIVLVVYFCSEDIVKIVYGHGSYSKEAVLQSGIALAMYGLCLIPVCVKTALSRAYYAVNDTKRPMVMGILEVVLNISLSVVLVRYYGIKGVVGATAIASFIMIIVMLIDYNRKYVAVFSKSTLMEYWKLILSCFISLGVIVIISKFFFINAFCDFVFKTIIVYLVNISVLLFAKDETIYSVLVLFRKKLLK